MAAAVVATPPAAERPAGQVQPRKLHDRGQGSVERAKFAFAMYQEGMQRRTEQLTAAAARVHVMQTEQLVADKLAGTACMG